MALFSSPVYSMFVNEDFTQPQTQNNWYMPRTGGGTRDNAACLTAGNNQNPASVNSIAKAGSPPACQSIKDPVGKGALRLTDTAWYSVGGVVSNFNFPLDEGIDLSFTTYTYGGDGADGMSFFLQDADPQYAISIGSTGGALGYSCPTHKFSTRGSGVAGGYIGIGIDEYGNFLNYNDAAMQGYGAFDSMQPGNISVRGAGNVNQAYLQSKYPFINWDETAMDDTCKQGYYSQDNGTKINIPAYPLLGYKILPKSMPLDNQRDKDRANAKPINYKLKISSEGILNFWVSYNGGMYQPIIVDQDIIKTNVVPMPKEVRFGFTGATGGQNNYHEITCFKAAPDTKTDGSTSINLPDDTFTTGAQVYVSLYNDTYWYGQLMAQEIVKLPTGKYIVDPNARWDAGCGLTGGKCSNMNNTNVPVQSPEKRTIWTYSPSKQSGINFAWESLDSKQQQALSTAPNNVAKNEAYGKDLLQYLRGNRSTEGLIGVEGTSAGKNAFRPRKGVLGDIIHSSPAWSGPPTKKQYNNHWQDKLYATKDMPESTGQSYADFTKLFNSRSNLVYIGANDGYLHAFRSGAYDNSGKNFLPTSQKPNDGREVFAYMPASVLSRINNNLNTLNYTNQAYAHNFYQDATAGVGDVYYNNKWHTLLLGGLGAGGASIYALDITDPEGLNQAGSKFEANDKSAQSKVIGEWSFKEKDPLWEHLGNTYGTPQFTRFHNGQWGAVFGNGLCLKNDAENGNCSASNPGESGIYIMLLDSKTGKPRFRFIGTKEGTNTNPNGIFSTTIADLDEDNIVDYVYAGDYHGNVWRFDLTSDDDKKWSQPKKLFKTPNNQPITTQVSLYQNKKNKQNTDVGLSFGTGYLSLGYLHGPDSYAKGTQSLYGIYDLYASNFPKQSAINDKFITQNDLVEQKINFLTNELDKKNVCLPSNNSSSCNGKPTKYGWVINLETMKNPGQDDEYEQIIYNPKLQKDTVIFNSFVNGSSSASACDKKSARGFTYAVDALTGQGLDQFFENPEDNNSRLPIGSVGDPSIIIIGDQSFIVSKNEQGVVELIPLKLDNNKLKIKRLSWREIVKQKNYF